VVAVSLVVDGALLRERIEETLKKIDVKYRDVLVLKYLEDKSYEEIGDILKKPGGSVATLLHRAKKQFMKYYSYDNA
jgi:RNA polymerase sigma-70 factor (ECF subfamily)